MLRPAPEGTIVADREGVLGCSGIAESRLGEIRGFFESDCRLDRKVTIRLGRDANRQLLIHIQGHLPVGTQQQIRNFLIQLL
jgi:hypothetical protein